MKKINIIFFLLIIAPIYAIGQNTCFDPIAFYSESPGDPTSGIPASENDTLTVLFKSTNINALDSIIIKIGTVSGTNDVKETICPKVIIGTDTYWVYNGNNCKIWGKSSVLKIPLTPLEKSYANWVSIIAIDSLGTNSTINFEIH